MHPSRIQRTLLLLAVLPGVATAGVLLQTTSERVQDLEDRVLRLEATVAALSDESSGVSEEDHSLSGEYIERPEDVSGTSCDNFYDPGTKVIVTDWDGEVLGSGELGDGELQSGGLCSQPFEIGNVPETPGYTIYFDRRSPGSAYEFTLEDMEESDWHIVVRSRYRE